jgi:hypothetical protein
MHNAAEKFPADKNAEPDRMSDAPINNQIVIPAQAGI